MWDESKCDLCGDCLVKCRYVNYDKDKAVAELKLLMAGEDADILHKCITCIACNDYLEPHLQDAGKDRHLSHSNDAKSNPGWHCQGT